MASLCNHKSRGRGEGFTGSHTLLEAGGRSVASRPCVQAHLAPKSCWAFWPCWGSWHRLPTLPLGSRWLCDNLRLPWKKKKKPIICFGENVEKTWALQTQNPMGKQMEKIKQMVVFAIFSCIIAVFSPDCAYKTWLLPLCMSLLNLLMICGLAEAGSVLTWESQLLSKCCHFISYF